MNQNREMEEAWEHYKEETLWATLEDTFRAGWLASQRARERAAFAELLEIEGDDD